MDVVAYVVSSLAIIWAFGGGQLTAVFWLRVLIAAPICLVTAVLLLKSRRELNSLRPNSGSWMMGVGIGLVMFLLGLVLAWFCKDRVAELSELRTFKLPGFLFWVFLLSPACEIIYRKVLGPAWGPKSSAFIEALNFGVGAVNLYLFCLIFIWGYLGSRLSMRFGIVAAIVARSLATFALLLSLRALN